MYDKKAWIKAKHFQSVNSLHGRKNADTISVHNGLQKNVPKHLHFQAPHYLPNDNLHLV